MAFWRSGQRSGLPDRLPVLKLARTDAIAGKVALVDRHKLGLRDFDEAGTVALGDVACRPGRNVGGGRLLIHRPADHIAHDLLERLPVAQPEWIGIARGLPDRCVARGGALVSP